MYRPFKATMIALAAACFTLNSSEVKAVSVRRPPPPTPAPTGNDPTSTGGNQGLPTARGDVSQAAAGTKCFLYQMENLMGQASVVYLLPDEHSYTSEAESGEIPSLIMSWRCEENVSIEFKAIQNYQLVKTSASGENAVLSTNEAGATSQMFSNIDSVSLYSYDVNDQAAATLFKGQRCREDKTHALHLGNDMDRIRSSLDYLEGMQTVRVPNGYDVIFYQEEDFEGVSWSTYDHYDSILSRIRSEAMVGS